MASAQRMNPKIIGAYDVRGIYPTDFDDEQAYLIARAFVQFLSADRVAVGRDMRVSSPALAAAVIRGVTDAGRRRHRPGHDDDR